MAALPLLFAGFVCCLQERAAVEPPPPRGLAVRVVDERGAPVVRARVTVVQPIAGSAWIDDEPLAELLRRGKSWWTGDDGVASVEVARADVRIVAQSPDAMRWGFARATARGGAPIELAVRLEPELPIEVVDAQGAPAAGIELRVEASSDASWNYDLIDPHAPVPSFAFRSGHDGRATLRAGDRFALAALAGLEDATWGASRMRVLAATLDAEAERVADAAGAERLRVTLPETCRIEVELHDREGRIPAIDVVGEATIEPSNMARIQGGHGAVYVVGERSSSRTVRLRFVAGRASIARVAVGAGVSVEVSTGTRHWRSSPRHDFDGSTAGVARLVVREEPPRAATSLRLVDESGAPLAARPVEVRLDCDGGETGSYLVDSDGDGRLLLLHETIDGKLRDRRPLLQRIEFRIDDEPATLRHGIVPVDRLRDGADLGDVVLASRSRPVAIAGRVVDERGRPLEGITLTAEVRGWFALERGRAKVTGADGAFAFHGWLEPGTIVTLDLSEPEFGTRCSGELPAGTFDARVDLLRFGAISGSLRLDPGIAPADLRVAIAEEATQPVASRGLAHFAIGALPPGRHAVEVWHYGALGPERLAEIADVEVPSAAIARDERLEEIDLRGLLSITTFRVVGPTGEPIARATLQFDESAARASETEPDESRADGGCCTIATVRALPEVTVRAPGFRTRRVTPTRGENVVDLAPALPYSIRFDPKELPRDEAWRIDVDPSHEEIDEELAVAPTEGAASRPWFERGLFRPDEELRLLASAPGRAQIDVHVMRLDPASQRWSCLCCATRSITLPDRRDAPPFVLALSAAELDELRAALHEAKAAEEPARKAEVTTAPVDAEGDGDNR